MSRVLQNMLEQQLIQIRKAMSKLHEDLQFDYNQEIERVFDLTKKSRT